MKLRTVGIREAKAKLSRLLREVQRGREWIITARGRPIARIVPVDQSGQPLDERVRLLEDSDVIEPLRQVKDLPPPLPLKQGLAQAWLQEDRGG